MDIRTALKTLTEGQSLLFEAMSAVMHDIMTGKATAAQIGGFLVALRMKGETVEEITAAASVMRELATRVEVSGDHVVDIVGTGGDGAYTFNISTTSTFIVAAAGGQVAKHGNRSISSKSGSADVLEALGVNLGISAAQVGQCIQDIGVGFMFAPQHHSAMKYAVGPRREMGIRTIFNLLGPLTNPAYAPNQLIGVFSLQWLEVMAQVSQRMGSNHLLVVHSEDGLDEISIAAPTRVAELKNDQISTYTLTPEDFGLTRVDLSAVRVETVEDSAAMVRGVLDNQPGAARDIVLLNAGTAIYAANLCDSIADGIETAREMLSSGAAREKLAALCALTTKMTKES